MTQLNNNSDVLGLAEEIDRQNQPEFQKVFNGNQQPLPNEVVVEDGPTLLDEDPVRVAQRRSNECLYNVEPGRLFHGNILDWELKKADNGSVFIKFTCLLESNNWKMTSTRFLPKSSLDTTEAIEAEQNKILADFGYNFETKQFDGVRLFEIGSYKGKDDKVRLKIERIYWDTKDYNSFQVWKWNKDHQPKKQWKLNSAPLPEKR